MIIPEDNSYVVVTCLATDGSQFVFAGRVKTDDENELLMHADDNAAFFTEKKRWFYSSPDEPEAHPLVNARIIHVHHQPSEADDSEAWRAVRLAVREAMRKARSQPIKAA